MKSKHLPNGAAPFSYAQGTAQLKQLFQDQQQRMQRQFYDDTLKEYLSNVSESMLHSNLPPFSPERTIWIEAEHVDDVQSFTGWEML